MDDLGVPVRRNGQPKAFWYDREGGHMIYRDSDGELTAIGFECRHQVVASHER